MDPRREPRGQGTDYKQKRYSYSTSRQRSGAHFDRKNHHKSNHRPYKTAPQPVPPPQVEEGARYITETASFLKVELQKNTNNDIVIPSINASPASEPERQPPMNNVKKKSHPSVRPHRTIGDETAERSNVLERFQNYVRNLDPAEMDRVVNTNVGAFQLAIKRMKAHKLIKIRNELRAGLGQKNQSVNNDTNNGIVHDVLHDCEIEAEALTPELYAQLLHIVDEGLQQTSETPSETLPSQPPLPPLPPPPPPSVNNYDPYQYWPNSAYYAASVNNNQLVSAPYVNNISDNTNALTTSYNYLDSKRLKFEHHQHHHYQQQQHQLNDVVTPTTVDIGNDLHKMIKIEPPPPPPPPVVTPAPPIISDHATLSYLTENDYRSSVEITQNHGAGQSVHDRTVLYNPISTLPDGQPKTITRISKPEDELTPAQEEHFRKHSDYLKNFNMDSIAFSSRWRWGVEFRGRTHTSHRSGTHLRRARHAAKRRKVDICYNHAKSGSVIPDAPQLDDIAVIGKEHVAQQRRDAISEKPIIHGSHLTEEVRRADPPSSVTSEPIGEARIPSNVEINSVVGDMRGSTQITTSVPVPDNNLKIARTEDLPVLTGAATADVTCVAQDTLALEKDTTDQSERIEADPKAFAIQKNEKPSMDQFKINNVVITTYTNSEELRRSTPTLKINNVDTAPDTKTVAALENESQLGETLKINKIGKEHVAEQQPNANESDAISEKTSSSVTSEPLGEASITSNGDAMCGRTQIASLPRPGDNLKIARTEDVPVRTDAATAVVTCVAQDTLALDQTEKKKNDKDIADHSVLNEPKPSAVAIINTDTVAVPKNEKPSMDVFKINNVAMTTDANPVVISEERRRLPQTLKINNADKSPDTKTVAAQENESQSGETLQINNVAEQQPNANESDAISKNPIIHGARVTEGIRHAGTSSCVTSEPIGEASITSNDVCGSTRIATSVSAPNDHAKKFDARTESDIPSCVAQNSHTLDQTKEEKNDKDITDQSVRIETDPNAIANAIAIPKNEKTSVEIFKINNVVMTPDANAVVIPEVGRRPSQTFKINNADKTQDTKTVAALERNISQSAETFKIKNTDAITVAIPEKRRLSTESFINRHPDKAKDAVAIPEKERPSSETFKINNTDKAKDLFVLVATGVPGEFKTGKLKLASALMAKKPSEIEEAVQTDAADFHDASNAEATPTTTARKALMPVAREENVHCDKIMHIIEQTEKVVTSMDKKIAELNEESRVVREFLCEMRSLLRSSSMIGEPMEAEVESPRPEPESAKSTPSELLMPTEILPAAVEIAEVTVEAEPPHNTDLTPAEEHLDTDSQSTMVTNSSTEEPEAMVVLQSAPVPEPVVQPAVAPVKQPSVPKPKVVQRVVMQSGLEPMDISPIFASQLYPGDYQLDDDIGYVNATKHLVYYDATNENNLHKLDENNVHKPDENNVQNADENNVHIPDENTSYPSVTSSSSYSENVSAGDLPIDIFDVADLDAMIKHENENSQMSDCHMDIDTPHIKDELEHYMDSLFGTSMH